MDEQTAEMGLQVSARLRALRRERGLSLEALAALCGVSKSMLSKVERGESIPTVGAAVRIAAALAVPLPLLLGIEERPWVEYRVAPHQEVVADPKSGTTRYRAFASAAHGTSVERLVAPPGSGALQLDAVEPGTFLVITITQGRFTVRMGESEWRAGAGDCVAIGGPADVTLAPRRGELSVACLFRTRQVPPPED